MTRLAAANRPAAGRSLVRNVFVVAVYSVRQWIRGRIVLACVAAGGGVVGISLLLLPLMQVDPERLVADVGLAGVELGGLAVLLLTGAMAYVEETERRSLTLILVKPLRRFEYVLGVYAGLCAVLVATCGALAAFTWAGVHLAGGGELTRAVFPAAALVAVQLCVLASLSLLFLQVSTSLVAAVVYPLGAYVLGALSPTLRYFVEHSDDPVLVAALRALRVLVPNFELFNFKNEDAYALPGAPLAGTALAYAAAYVTAVLLLAVRAFSRREH